MSTYGTEAKAGDSDSVVLQKICNNLSGQGALDQAQLDALNVLGPLSQSQLNALNVLGALDQAQLDALNLLVTQGITISESSIPLSIISHGSILGDVISAVKRSQYDINFSTADATDATLITNTVTGTGAITQAGGLGIYSTGVGASGRALGVTVQSLTYRAGTDIFSNFTAAFTAPTDAVAANNYQRIGLYNSANGIFIGYEGTSFGITVRRASVDSRTASTSFNLDLLNGAAGSDYTRNGVIEAVNFTMLNLYRIRFSWFGVAPIFFDVFSPDGRWVPFHVIRYPNTSILPQISTPNLPMTIDSFKSGSNATNLQIRTGSWAAGLTEAAIRLNDPLVDSTLAIPTRSVLTGRTTTNAYTNVKVTNAGELITAPIKLVTYQAVYRLVARPYALVGTLAVAGRVQFATIFHTAASTKTVRLRHVTVAVEDSTLAAIYVAELVRITTAPATGNPVITPTASIVGTVAESTCLALPTTIGTEAGLFGMQEWNLGNTAAATTLNPPPALQFQDLINPGSASEKDNGSELPSMRPGVAEGWAVTVDYSTGPRTLRTFVIITFTEE